MTKTYCDRCGEVVNENVEMTTLHFQQERTSGLSVLLVLCPLCWHLMLKFLDLDGDVRRLGAYR
jgi:hypothetical protein